ncbi:MAG: hypothetical protein ACRDQG_04680 [Pseudonocardiaceae bacterium]
MSEVDREEISRGIAEQVEGRVIVERIGRDPSVVCRDIAGVVPQAGPFADLHGADRIVMAGHRQRCAVSAIWNVRPRLTPGCAPR